MNRVFSIFIFFLYCFHNFDIFNSNFGIKINFKKLPDPPDSSGKKRYFLLYIFYFIHCLVN